VGRLKTLAARRGWHLNADGLLSADRSATVGTSEEEIYAALGLPFIPPEIRDGADELRAAEQGTLPTLVSQAHIRGDLHMHSSYSDGRDSVETMATRCRGLGYEYLAITDHSTHSPAPRNLTADGAKRQAEEIAALREQYPDIAILHGCEVEILPNGRLDFPDRILERFDLVLASLHEGAGQSPERLLRRYASTMRHPLVNVITHPTNRLIPYTPGYDLDYDRLFEIAAETGTVLEIDGAPAHLDLDGALARRALGAGVTLAISSDSHRADMLDHQMQLGLVTARRGWVEPRHVLNARPLAEVRDAVARKRQGQV
jgi:DNA polymerase (family 10)